jgi:hypothetical protein
MARIRTVKPSLFTHEVLWQAEQDTGLPLRVAFIGLFTASDREGRFKWRPRELKLAVLPYDDVDFSRVLDGLQVHGLVAKYEVDGEFFGYIPTWAKHQAINQRESQSTLPDPHGGARACTLPEMQLHSPVNIPSAIRATVLARDENRCSRCAAKSDLTIDHIFPQSIGGTHLPTNLRILCRSCNSARPVQGKGLIDDLAKDGLTMDDMQRMCMHVTAHVEGKRKGSGKEVEGEATRKRAPTFDAASIDLPEWLNPDLWKTWVADRAQRRKPITENAAKQQIADLTEWHGKGLDIHRAIKDAINGGWQGLFEPKTKANGANGHTPPADLTEQWMALRGCIRDGRQPADPILAAVALKFGGIHRLGERTTFDLDRMRRDFDSAYNSAKSANA